MSPELPTEVLRPMKPFRICTGRIDGRGGDAASQSAGPARSTWSAKAALKTAMMAYHQARVHGAELAEAAEDLFAEAKAEGAAEIFAAAMAAAQAQAKAAAPNKAEEPSKAEAKPADAQPPSIRSRYRGHPPSKATDHERGSPTGGNCPFYAWSCAFADF